MGISPWGWQSTCCGAELQKCHSDPGKGSDGQKMGPRYRSPPEHLERPPARGLCCGGPSKHWGPQSTSSCRGEPTSPRLHPHSCFLSAELSPAAVLDVAPPWPGVGGWHGAPSSPPVLPWPCSASWSTWASCALPADGVCCPSASPPGAGDPRWRWGAAQGDPACAHPELGLLGSAALLTPNLQL